MMIAAVQPIFQMTGALGLARILVCTVLLFLPTLLSGCLTAGLGADASPLLRTGFHRATGESEAELLVPIFAERNSPGRSEWAVRPLMGYRRNEAEDFTEFDFLPPLGRYFRHDDRTRFRFWPLYSYSKVARPEGDDVDWIFFPLLFGGRSPGGENYFAFFPLGGCIRDFLTYDSFSFALWPLYQRVTKKISAAEKRRSTSFLLLFGWTDGGRMDGSWHALPFYMKSVWKGRYKKYSVLWPFFHYQEKALDTDHPAKAYGFWPLFHLEGADNYYRYGFIGPLIFLGPLVQLGREVPDRWEGKPNGAQNAYYIYDVPWPLVHIEKTRDCERFRIFPFYSHYREEDATSSFDSKSFLTPLFWLRNSKNLEYEKSDFFFIPLVTRIHKVYADHRGEDSYFQLWPLFHTDSTFDGGYDFSTLSLMPSRLATPLEAVDRLFWPFWNLYRYQEEPTGAQRHKALFNLISAYYDDAESRFSIPLLYNYLNVDGVGWEHNFLWKLLTIEGDDEGLQNMRLLFIPIVSSSKNTMYPGGIGP